MQAGKRTGMTLIELLVVIFIILTVTALAIPIIAPAMRGRQVREASRIITAYLAGARSESLKTGRSVGVVFEMLPESREWCFNLSQCKVPPPYAGDTISDTATMTVSGGMNIVAPSTPWLAPTDQLARVKVGDLIKFNYQGHLYQLAYDTTGSQWYIGEEVSPNVWNMYSETATQPITISGAKYQVFRQPTRTATAPVQLPAGIVIDMNYSGDDTGPFVVRDRSVGGFTGTDYENDPYVGALVPTFGSVAVIFSPNGSVEKLYRHDSTGTLYSIRPTSPIHFMLGERARVPVTVVETHADIQTVEGDAEAQLEAFNYQDLDSFWVSINPSSGKVDSTENAVATPIANPPATPMVGPIADGVRQSRLFATEGQATSSQQ